LSFIKSSSVFSYLYYVKKLVPSNVKRKESSFSIKKIENYSPTVDSFFYCRLRINNLLKPPTLFQSPLFPINLSHYPSFTGAHYGRTHFLKYFHHKYKCQETTIVTLKNDNTFNSDIFPHFDDNLFKIMIDVGKNTSPGFSYNTPTKKKIKSNYVKFACCYTT